MSSICTPMEPTAVLRNRLGDAPCRSPRVLSNAARRAKIGILTTVAVMSFAAMAPAAWGAGTSPKTNGCYAQWWNTAFSGYCTPATVSGYYRIFADCAAPQAPDIGGTWRYIGKGSMVRPFDSRECRFGINFARVEFKG